MEEMNLFVGMVKGTNLFLLGEVVDKNPNQVVLRWCVRVFEMPKEGRIGYQFHPDPYFTTDVESQVDLSEFLIYRIESNQDSKIIREYKNFLTQVRIQKSGLVGSDNLKSLHP
jgi:hypothetical protein